MEAPEPAPPVDTAPEPAATRAAAQPRSDPADPPPAAAAGGEIRLLGLGGESDEGGTTAFLRAQAPLSGRVTFSRLDGPPRYLVKVKGAVNVPTVELQSDDVQRVRTGLHGAGESSEVHVVFDLAVEGLDIEPSVEGQLVRIRFSRAGA